MRRRPVLHPFLFALFPILAFYAYNIRSIPIPLRELAGPLGVSLAGSAALVLVFSALFRERNKAGIAASLVVLWFLSFGRLAGWLARWTEGLYSRSLFFATALLVGLAVFLIGRSRRDLGGLTRVLNTVAAVLVLWNVASVVQTLARRPHPGPSEKIVVRGPGLARPNIYYIVLDAYTRADVLREIFDFDNAPFLSALEERGFVVAGRSCANYSQTYQSLASSLNFTLLDELARDVGTASSDREPLYAMIRDNKAMAFLKSQGYRVLTVSSSLEPTDFRAADRYFGFALSNSEFRTGLLNTTPLPFFLGSRESAAPYEAHRGRILNAFRALEGSPLEKGPFFMVVHVMAPHPPFVFGPRGEPTEPDYLFSMVDADRLHGGGEAARREYIARYRDQTAALNARILEAVDAILERSPESPVIVLQGDHGSRAYMDFDRPEASYFRENLAILNAYYLPGEPRSFVYPSISPVNTFRLIFRSYFGAELDLLPDKSAWSTWRRPYKFMPYVESDYAETVESIRRRTRPKPPIVQKR